MSKLKMLVRRIPNYGVYLFLLLCVVACYEPIDGCLDVRSTNFGYDADNECDDCCTYPSLKLNINFVYDTLSYNSNTPYIDAEGDSFRLSQIEFFISEVSVDRDDGLSITSQDSFLIPGQNNAFTYIYDNNHKVTSRTRLATISDIRDAGEFSSIHFLFGPSEVLHSVDTLILETDNPWYTYIDDYGASGIDWLHMEVISGEAFADTTSYIFNSTYPSQDIFIQKEISKSDGEELSFTIDVDTKEWLDGIAFQSMSMEEVKLKLLENAQGIFSID